MVFYTKNGIMAALHLKYCSIFPPETYRFNVWISKNKHVHLSILKLNQEKLGKYEKFDEIEKSLIVFIKTLVIMTMILMMYIT